MKKIKLKQGSLEWEKYRATRIGSSDVFDIVRYYATDEELQNCGINAEDFKAEEPYTTAWALYHKVLNDGLYRKEELAPEFAEYGHAIEPYGMQVLQRSRANKVRQGGVYISDRLIASLDVEGVSESVDVRPFDYGNGKPKTGRRFVCEQKSMMPQKLKYHMPFKYIVQAQYQIMETKADFFILQIMVLKEDTPFIRGKICQMSKSARTKYLDKNMTVSHYYFANNYQLGTLIDTCLNRFFADADGRKEPNPFSEYDSQKNIIQSVRANTLFNDDYVIDYDLTKYLEFKQLETRYEEMRRKELDKIIEQAKKHNACRFTHNGVRASFSKSGAFLIKEVNQ